MGRPTEEIQGYPGLLVGVPRRAGLGLALSSRHMGAKYRRSAKLPVRHHADGTIAESQANRAV